jgi:hypothetical protein
LGVALFWALYFWGLHFLGLRWIPDACSRTDDNDGG